MKMLSRKFKRSCKQTIVSFMGITILLIVVSIVIGQLQNGNQNKSQTAAGRDISQDVLQYEPVITKYAKKYKVEQHVTTLMAIMMQESGGRGKDPMQASESLCGKRNCITDPEKSIKQGVAHFSHTLKRANNHVDVAIQSYNFGPGFADYVTEQNKNFSPDLAIQYSQMKYKTVPNPDKYRCIREESKELDACFGDIHYVEAVKDYEHTIQASSMRSNK